MSIRRIVPNIKSEQFRENQDFYARVLGLRVAMDRGWILTFESPAHPTSQISIIRDRFARRTDG